MDNSTFSDGNQEISPKNVENSNVYVDNSKNDDFVPQEGNNIDTKQTVDNEILSSVKSELAELKEDLSTIANADKQREKSIFSENSEQLGQPEKGAMWKTEKLSTITVENIYAISSNPFKAGLLVKKNMARGLEADGEQMLFAMVAKLDFKCDCDVCEIRVMDKLAPILYDNMQKLEKHSSGFKIKIIGIETFTQNTQVEVDKIKKYFGEEYLKMVQTLSK